MLDLISPVLNSNENFSYAKKRGQALAKVLTSPEHIANRKTHARNVTKKKLKQAVKKSKITKITKRQLNKERR